MRGVLYICEISSLVQVFLGPAALTACSKTEVGEGEGGALCGIEPVVRGISWTMLYGLDCQVALELLCCRAFLAARRQNSDGSMATRADHRASGICADAVLYRVTEVNVEIVRAAVVSNASVGALSAKVGSLNPLFLGRRNRRNTSKLQLNARACQAATCVSRLLSHPHHPNLTAAYASSRCITEKFSILFRLRFEQPYRHFTFASLCVEHVWCADGAQHGENRWRGV